MIKLSVLVICLASLSIRTNAEVIMTVNLSDPSVAVFSSTPANAQNTFVDVTIPFYGITLVGFFAGNTVDDGGGHLLVSGAIEVFDSSVGTTRGALDSIFVGTFDGGYTLNDVSFWGFDEFFLTFLDSKRALAGSATDDLSPFMSLPEAGAIGDIVVGEPVHGQVIGQWQVVPEPSVACVVLGAAIGLFAVYRMGTPALHLGGAHPRILPRRPFTVVQVKLKALRSAGSRTNSQ